MSTTIAESRLDLLAEIDRERKRVRSFRLFALTDCEVYIGRDDTAGRYEGATVYDDLADVADQYDWKDLADWCDHADHDDWCDRAESSDCDDPTIY